MDNQKENFLSKTIVVCLGAFVCCLLWGSAFPVIKIGYKLFNIASKDSATQILFAGIRFFLAGVMAVFIGSIIEKKPIYPKKQSITKIIKLSLLQTVAQYVFFYIGLARTTGVRASIVEGTNVFVALVVASLIFKQEKLTTRKIIGCVIGFLGVILVNITSKNASAGNYILGDCFIVMSTVAYAFSSVLLKEYSKEEAPVVLSGYQFIVGGSLMVIAGLIFGGRIEAIDRNGVGVLLYLAFVSAVAYSLWGILMKYNPISKVAVFGFMTPVFGVILSAILLGEGSSIGVIHVLSLILVCVGIYIVNSIQKNKNRS